MAGDWTGTHPHRQGQAWMQRGGSETALHDPRSGVLHFVNPPALAIWELCDGDTTPEEMAEAINELTGLGSEASLTDVHAALDSLLAAGLVTT